MDTEEMYRRGVADADRGEPHPFYYEHYYQYRRGYDRARHSRGLPGGFYDRRRRRVLRLGAVGAVLIVGLAALLFWRNRSPATTAAQPTRTQPVAAASAPPPRSPVFPTPTIPPTPPQAGLHVGGSARVVNVAGAALRSRKEPMLKAAATAAFKEGETVTILEGPIEADGFVWWRIQGPSGAGWSAQQSRDGTPWLQANTS
ncbi:hypothetical protein [Kouleothrix sp.]|uniref:hypothetical protein n=1 Tax=Kouleothrix sp. TaxID=2779161 RepID=UPI00391DC842